MSLRVADDTDPVLQGAHARRCTVVHQDRSPSLTRCHSAVVNNLGRHSGIRLRVGRRPQCGMSERRGCDSYPFIVSRKVSAGSGPIWSLLGLIWVPAWV